MRLVTYAGSQGRRAGILQDGQVFDLELASGGSEVNALPSDLGAVLAKGEPAWKQLRELAESEILPTISHKIGEVRLLAPLQHAGKIIGVARNYWDWLAQANQSVPLEPTLFAKLPNTVVGPGDPVRLPRCAQQVTYEAEVAVVIGRPGRDILASRAMAHVAGYTIINDVTASDVIRRDGNSFRGKNFDTFAPMGPWLTSADEISAPHGLSIRLKKNGKLLQNSSTTQMVMGIPELISYISRAITLNPGDIIATGTPGGTAVFHAPPAYLAAGDDIEITIEGLGVLCNPVTSE